MIITNQENRTIITQERVTVIELVKKIEALYPKYQNQNIIIQLNSITPISTETLSEFLLLAKNHKKANKSFVIVYKDADLDGISDELVVVPTVKEAHDIIEMEVMERDLGI